MAQIVDPTNLQKLEYDVTTAEGPSHVTIVTGLIPVNFSSGGGVGNVTGSFETLVDPTLAPGQFRKATAIASIAGWSSYWSAAPPPPTQAGVSIQQVEATLDDESGKIQLRIDTSAWIAGSGNAGISMIAFQVTTLSKLSQPA